MIENLILIGIGAVLGVILTATVIVIVGRRKLEAFRNRPGVRLIGAEGLHYSSERTVVEGDLEVDGDLLVRGPEITD